MTTAGTRLYFIRHGETEANKRKLWHGATDTDLTGLGEWQAEQMGQYLKANCSHISAVYASPLKRTKYTALALSTQLGCDLQTHPDLREYGIGIFEGTSFDTLMYRHKFFATIASDQDYAPDGGESVNQVMARMLAALSEIAERHPGDAVAIVSHGAAMAIALAAMLDGSAFPFSQYHMSNTGITSLQWGETPALILFDQTRHLSQESIT